MEKVTAVYSYYHYNFRDNFRGKGERMRYVNRTIKVNNKEIKNRLVMPPMATSKASEGTVTPEHLEYYDEKTKGGYIGLVVLEHSYVSEQGKAKEGQMSISKDSDVEGMSKLVDIIHRNGSMVLAQINHAGSSTLVKSQEYKVIGPSAVKNPALPAGDAQMPAEMTKAEIEGVKADFISAAKRAKAAGFDGVEIHSAHSYLLNQFYSPLTNKRNDEYTGSTISGRLQLLKEIYTEIRAALGSDYIIAVRLGGSDYMEGGSTIEDCVEAAKAFETWGVDLIDLTGGMCRYVRNDCTEPGYFKDMSEAVKAVVKTPVILTGGVTTIDELENLLAMEKADMIGVGRAILKDSAWPEKNMK